MAEICSLSLFPRVSNTISVLLTVQAIYLTLLLSPGLQYPRYQIPHICAVDFFLRIFSFRKHFKITDFEFGF